MFCWESLSVACSFSAGPSPASVSPPAPRTSSGTQNLLSSSSESIFALQPSVDFTPALLAFLSPFLGSSVSSPLYVRSSPAATGSSSSFRPEASLSLATTSPGFETRIPSWSLPPKCRCRKSEFSRCNRWRSGLVGSAASSSKRRRAPWPAPPRWSFPVGSAWKGLSVLGPGLLSHRTCSASGSNSPSRWSHELSNPLSLSSSHSVPQFQPNQWNRDGLTYTQYAQIF